VGAHKGGCTPALGANRPFWRVVQACGNKANVRERRRRSAWCCSGSTLRGQVCLLSRHVPHPHLLLHKGGSPLIPAVRASIAV